MSDLDDDLDDLFDSDWESSDDDLLEIVLKVTKSEASEHQANSACQCDDKEFLDNYRISKQLVDEIAKRFENSEHYKWQEGQYGKIRAKNQVLIFLFYIGHKTTTFRDVAKRFNITISSLHRIITRVSVFLSNLSPEVITWPNHEKKKIIEQNFRENGFPDVCGVIGGFHVRIDKPEVDANLYMNAKQFHSVHMQLVCDRRKKILDVYVGFPGSADDTTVFVSSSLGQNLEDRCGRYRLLGGDGYPLMKNLLTPYRETEELTTKQINYNKRLLDNRYVIEQCFEMLTEAFRQLRHIKLRNIQYVVHLIRAACVVHNMSLDSVAHIENDHDYALFQKCEVPSEQPHNFDGGNGDFQEDEEAIQLREEVVNTLDV